MQFSDDVILRAMNRFSAVRERGTLPNLLAFARVLKIAGLKVSLSQVLDASHSLEFMDISRKADFRDVLRSNLICRKEEIAIFDRVFDSFWRDWQIRSDSTSPGSEPEDKPGEPEHGGVALEEVIAQISGEDVKTNEEEPFPVPTYSPVETISRKDFSEMGIDESRAISQAILLIASKIATQMSRRKKRGAKGDEIDPRWTMRRSLKYGGEVVELVSRKRRIKKTRVVLLCDVSGSMDCYSRFLIQFMYGLQNELWGVETFVFSTSLSRITHLIRTREIADALERIAGSVLGWSGGTNIGQSLSMFNREFAPGRVTNRTVVVIISDGWDRGDVSLMEREMRDLKRRCHKIIWLNPLLASENYEPLCKGMQAALPYVDLFLSVHNLNSLVALGRTLQRLAA
jgi:uncharacterized protein with von Willebrand factor type A (vWA) domain